jgi:hypothetical protein
MPTPTYDSIFSLTLSTSAATVTLGSGGTGTIPSTFTDLVLVIDGTLTSGATNPCRIKFNGDSGSNYSFNRILTTGGAFANDQSSNNNNGILVSDLAGTHFSVIYTFIDYANTSVVKTTLSHQYQSEYMGQYVGRWNSTSAINSILLTPVSAPFSAGTTFSLYGIKAGS